MAITKLNSLAIPPATVVESDSSFPLDSASFTGDLTVDTDSLVVDSTNNRVGIKKASPEYPLSVSGDVQIEKTSAGILKLKRNDTATSTGNGIGQIQAVTNEGGTDAIVALMRFEAGDTVGADGEITLETSGSERVRVDSDGNVGIGETNPSAKLEVNGDVHVTGSGGTKLLVENTQPKITLRDTSVVGAESDEFIIRSTASQSSGDYEFVLNNDLTSSADLVVMKFSALGNVGIGLEDPRTVLEVSGSTNRPLTVNSSNTTSVITFTDSATASIGHVKVGSEGNDLVFYAGASEQARIRAFGGIAFNGDTAAANALDDYEEGTWPVTLSDGTTTSGTLVTGRYTKIGQVVIARFDACNNINPTGFVGGNNVRISLPFTAGSTGRSTGAVIVDGIDRGSRTQVNSKVSDNVAFANIVKSGSNLNDIAVNWSDINSASYVNDIVDFCIVYTV